MINDRPIKIVALVGGSGAGKTWLADRLQRDCSDAVARLSLDDFYLDRSYLSPRRRATTNFDHPQAIDWPLVEQALQDCRAGRPTELPRYSFATHTRLRHREQWSPAPLVIVEGLWLLWRTSIRRLFDLRVYLDCPSQLRLERRLTRDVAERGRTTASIREQFWKTVAPMHDIYVAPQTRWADIILTEPPSELEIQQLIHTIQTLEPRATQELTATLARRARVNTPVAR